MTDFESSLFASSAAFGEAVSSPAQRAFDSAVELASEIAASAVERDRDRIFPHEELAALKASGLLAALVPTGDGGEGLKLSDHLRIVRLLAQGDPCVAQMFHGHGLAIYVLNLLAEPTTRVELNRRVANRSLLWANAVSELGTANALAMALTAGPTAGGWSLNGTKFYCTGSLGADELLVAAMNTDATSDDDAAVLAFVSTDAEGLTINDDWDGMGQRTTASGTVVFSDVFVSDLRTCTDMTLTKDLASPRSILAQSGFTSVYLGIAEDALLEAINYLRDEARPYPYSGVERALDDPYILQHVGKLRCMLDAAHCLNDRALDLLDETEDDPTPATRGRAAIAMAQAKAVSTEAVLEVTQRLFQLCGSRSTRQGYGFDRHWRNARTLTLHDPVDYKYRTVGQYALDGSYPEITTYT